MAKTTFIYCLKDPTTGDVRYIGKTEELKKRFRAHLATSAKKNRPLGHWLRSLSEPPILAVLHEVSEGECWAEEEQRYISCARALGIDLVNSTDGGEGAPGYVCTPETRAAMRTAKLGVPRGPHSLEHCEAIRAALTGVPKSPEHRAALSIAHAGVPLSTKHCAALSAALTPERRAVISAALTGVPWSPARRAAYERRWGSK